LNQIHRGQFKSWVSKFSWQRAATVTVGWFAGRTGKTAVSGTPNCLNYCVFLQYINSLQMWPQAAKYNLEDRMRPAGSALDIH